MLQRWLTRICEDHILLQDEELRAFVESDFGVRSILFYPLAVLFVHARSAAVPHELTSRTHLNSTSQLYARVAKAGRDSACSSRLSRMKMNSSCALALSSPVLRVTSSKPPRLLTSSHARAKVNTYTAPVYAGFAC